MPSKTKVAKKADRALMRKIEANLRRHFPRDTVDVSPGYHDNVHVLVVSRKFDRMSEKRKQDYLWELINSGDLTEEERTRISLILPLSPAEVK